jgi:hypothetical protein
MSGKFMFKESRAEQWAVANQNISWTARSGRRSCEVLYPFFCCRPASVAWLTTSKLLLTAPMSSALTLLNCLCEAGDKTLSLIHCDDDDC